MNFLDKLKEFMNKIFGRKVPQLPEGNPNIQISEQQNSEHDAFVYSMQQQAQLSPEEIAERDSKLAKTAAYNCLADMVVNAQFNDKKHLGMSFEKSQFRLQLEEQYKDYGHGSEISESMIPETHIKVAREIQRSLSRRTKFVEGYGLVQDNTLSNFLSNNGLDLKTILSQNNGAILEQISNRFMSAGHHFTDFNFMDVRDTAIETMHQSLMQALEAHVQEQQYGKI